MDLVAALLEDHQELRTLFAKVSASAGPERIVAYTELRTSLVRHEVAEEAIVRSLTKTCSPSGRRIAEARVREEWQDEWLLENLEKAEMSSPEWEMLFHQLRSAVLTHAENEETVEFPRLQQNLEAAELERKAVAYETAKKLAPTDLDLPLPVTATAARMAS
jgi:hypothetical protein